MSEVLNFYLHKYGLSTKEGEDIKINRNDRARDRWGLLRANLRSVSQIIEKEDLRDNRISHGIQFVRRVSHVNDIEQALYLSPSDSYLTLDGCSVRLFDSQGRYKNVLSYDDIDMAFRRLTYASGSDRFVAWTPFRSDLGMLGPSFEVIERVDGSFVSQEIAEVLYNEDRNEIISSHSNELIIWQFRYANKHLIPRRTISLNHKDPFPIIYAIERTQKEHQRFFLVNDCTVTIIELSKGTIMTSHKSLHEQPITALTFFNPLKFLVTGCKVGSIKIWSFPNDEITLNMVFVGHTRSITSLAFFPGGCQATIASCGNDKTLRVWSLELNDEVECLELEYSSNTIGSHITKSTFFTVGTNFIDIWHQNNVSDDLMTLSSPPSCMAVITENPSKMLISCRNNLVFFIKLTKSNEVITKTVLPKPNTLKHPSYNILSIVYLENMNTLLVLVQDNRILHFDTKTQPMVQVSSHEYVSENVLLQLTAYKPVMESSKQSQNKSLILSGSSRGWIMVHDINHLENVTFQIEAHSESSITCMVADPSNSKFFTSGLDNSIKVWHVYPFSVEPLSKILSFFCGLLPSNLVNINNYLFTVFHDSERSQYPSVVYNIETRGRYDHSPNDDHIEPVNSVSACPRMKLFLSCSGGSENVIKIWTCKNVLLRQIEIHFPVHYAIFSSSKADIYAAVGHQVCCIDHKRFLPMVYIKKQVLMHFECPPDDDEPLIEFDCDIFQKNFDPEEREKMQGIKSVFRYQSYTDILSQEESEEIARINEIRKYNFDKLKALEDDISNIQHGRHQKPSGRYEKFLKRPLKNDIFDLYFSQIVKYHKITLPVDDKIEEVDEMLKSKYQKKYNKPEREGFFPSRESMNKMMAPNNIRKGGYIPNSSILQTLWSPKVIKEKADIWKPPILSSLDISTKEALMSEPHMSDDEVENGNMFFEWDSDEDPVKDPLDVPTEIISDKLSDDILSKFGSLLETQHSSTPVEELKEFNIGNVSESLAGKEMVKRSLTTKTKIKLPEITRKPKTMPEMRKVKFISSPDPSPVFMTQVPDQDPTCVEKISMVSILPQFLQQFAKEKWFLKICPPPHHDVDCCKNLPSPLNPSTFVMYTLQLLETTDDPEDMLGMVNTVHNLYSLGIIDSTILPRISTVIVDKIHNLLELESETKIDFLKSSLDILASLERTSDKTLVSICLSRYFDADPELKSFLKSILYRIGLEDNTDLIGKELATFKLPSVKPGTHRSKDLMKLVSDWLRKWFESMVFHAAKCQEVIGKEIHLIETLYEKLSDITIESLEDINSIFRVQIKSSADLFVLDPIEKNPNSILNYVNSLNFFRFKKLQKSQTVEDEKVETVRTKKTIVSLPKLNSDKQCLVRLGESNAVALKIRSKRDFPNLDGVCMKNAIVDNTQHPSMQPFQHYQVALGGGFMPFLHLHLKPCLVNPFPMPEDLIEWQNINGKPLSQMYNRSFIPQLSLPPEPF